MTTRVHGNLCYTCGLGCYDLPHVTCVQCLRVHAQPHIVTISTLHSYLTTILYVASYWTNTTVEMFVSKFYYTRDGHNCLGP